jgi:dethiobiotin synthetase
VIVAVTGTGTGVGKTHVACALLGALIDRGARAVGWKPVESGVDDSAVTDEALLREVSQVATPTLRLRAPLAPHVAARLEGITIDEAGLRATLDELTARFDVVVLELAGGLFSPFSETLDNAQWLAPLGARVLVVAPDRLGVLHDVTATVRAAATVGLAVHGIVLSAPAVPDASTGTNADELRARPALRGVPVTTLPRAPIAELRRDPAVLALAALD